MFLLLKQAVKGHSVTARRCKSAIVEDWNKNLLGWVVCHRVINLTDTHFGNCLLGSYWKQIHKAGRKIPSMEPKSRYLLHGRKQNLKMLLGKKKSSLRASFQDVCCCFPAFWVVVVVVLLSDVSTQPQTQTHYYVKYNMQTQNLKPYNLKIQHMENVNRRYGVRSCFHLLLPAVDAQKRKKSFVYVPSLHQNNFQRAVICPKWGHWLFDSEIFQNNFSSVRKWI